MADGNKSEQPTERRRTKAREQGQVARSRELPGALAVVAVLCWLLSRGPADLRAWSDLFRRTLEAAASQDVTLGTPILQWSLGFGLRWMTIPLLAAWGAGTAATLAQGGFVFSAEALAFKVDRLSPTQKLQQLFSAAGLSNTLKSLLPFAIVLWLAVAQVRDAWPRMTALSAASAGDVCHYLFQQTVAITWKLCLVLLLWSGVDYLLQRQRMESQLKMSREEIKEEFKESEGNPQVKAKIRRLQRQARRAQMLRAVTTASVVVTNPTHYALALEYRPEMGAPVLVAKGLDRFAEEIKHMALWYEVPLVENPPLAHALYRTVEVGQAIPSKLYTAVAEILAAIYRAQRKLKNS